MEFQPGLIVFSRRLVIKGLMGPDIVIDVRPRFKLLVMSLEVQIDVINLIKLLPMGPIRPLNVAVELGRPRRKDEERDFLAPASFLELIFEL